MMVIDLYKMHFKEININDIVCNDYFDYLIKAKKIETCFKENLVIYYTRYDHEKSVRILSLYYHELMEKIEQRTQRKQNI